MSTPRSTALFHFTSSLDVLKSILNNGFLPRFSLEDIQWLGFPQNDAIAFPVACFCDIPLSKISDHVQAYGQFGIGMKRDWGIANGLNPLVYVSQTSHMAGLLKETINTANVAKKANTDESHVDNIRQVIGYCKPITGQMTLHGKPVNREFYQESEWRYLATHDQVPTFMNEQTFADQIKRDNGNKLAAQHCPLTFSLQDVKYLFVQADHDIPDLVSFIQAELGSHPMRDVQMLTTRILSQDTIENDI